MDKRTPSKWLTLLAACFGLLMLYIDLFIVNVALPAIGQSFRAPLGTTSWTISGYVLMIGILPMGMGRLGDLWGQRLMYLAGLAIFSSASLACGLAPNITTLILFRIIQGIGAAIMTPGTLSIIVRAFPAHQHGLAIGIYGGISGLGLIAGPVLGGLLVQGDSWRWIFFVNVPVGLIAMLMAMLFVPESRETNKAGAIDWPGLLFLSTGLLFLLFGITRAGDAGWTDGAVVASCLLGGMVLVVFVVTERRVRQPLIDLSLLRNLPFVMGCLSFFFFSAALFGSQPYWSLFMQNTWGYSPLQGGLAFLPATGLIALFTPFTGVLAQRAGSRLYLFILLGLLLTGVSFLYVVLALSPQSNYLDGLLPPFLARACGIPLFTSCATLAIVSALSSKQAGLSAGTLGMARNIGTAFGVAVLSQIYLFHMNAALPAFPGASKAAAERFTAAGQGASHILLAGIIVDGFKLISLTCLILCCSAMMCAFFIRPRLRTKSADLTGAPDACSLSASKG
jgi:DHA2 family methylenomycin A resistance protein-like MFS transporter